jgi:hypothetical protein
MYLQDLLRTFVLVSPLSILSSPLLYVAESEHGSTLSAFPVKQEAFELRERYFGPEYELQSHEKVSEVFEVGRQWVSCAACLQYTRFALSGGSLWWILEKFCLCYVVRKLVARFCHCSLFLQNIKVTILGHFLAGAGRPLGSCRQSEPLLILQRQPAERLRFEVCLFLL